MAAKNTLTPTIFSSKTLYIWVGALFARVIAIGLYFSSKCGYGNNGPLDHTADRLHG